MTTPPLSSPQYPQPHTGTFVNLLAQRGLDTWAAFVVPHLRPGLRVLDVGCGPGSLSCDLAEAVAPGEVVGVDIGTAPVAQATQLAQDRGLTNIRFQVGDAMALPFPDASFDVVFSHGVVMYFVDPLPALREFHRVLRPGGLVAIKDQLGMSLNVTDPSATALRRFYDLMDQGRVYLRGADALTRVQDRGRQLASLGFTDIESTVVAQTHGTPEQLQNRHARFATDILRHPRVGILTAVEQGWVDQATLNQLADEIEAWALTPGAYQAGIWLAVVGRRGTEAAAHP